MKIILTVVFISYHLSGFSQSEIDFAQFGLDTLISKTKVWNKFFDHSSMFAGIYKLDIGAEDKQSPHADDEIYYVLSGNSHFEAGQNKSVIKPGEVLFVKRGVSHRFYDITAPLTILVFFAKSKN